MDYIDVCRLGVWSVSIVCREAIRPIKDEVMLYVGCSNCRSIVVLWRAGKFPPHAPFPAMAGPQGAYCDGGVHRGTRPERIINRRTSELSMSFVRFCRRASQARWSAQSITFS